MSTKRMGLVFAMALLVGVAFGSAGAEDDGWVSLFDGETLDGWRAAENPESFKVMDGKIIVRGKRGHLFYEGDVGDAEFKNFEFRCKVRTFPKANSGVFFHTEYQDHGWPKQGYEVQVNASHSDRRKTGSIYAVKDVLDNAPHEDGEWFDLYFKVDGERITVKVDGEVVNQYVERPEDIKGERKLSQGTIALQGHDPDSLVHYKDIYIRVGRGD